jgi:hypothetical protein
MITHNNINKAIETIRNNNTREYIRILAEEKDNLGVFSSKFGGIPYIANDDSIPVDSDNNQLALLTQINCGELPENKLYPEVGLLQFWIARNSNFGLDNKDSYCVKYIEKIDETVSEVNILEKYDILDEDNNEEYSPFKRKNTSFSLTFEKGLSTITSTDCRFEDIALKTIQDLFPDEQINDLYDDLENDIYSTLFKSFEGVQHAIGAYPTFTQWDPRNPDDTDVYDVMLLQIESMRSSDSNENEIMWGDSGVANFFIDSEKLERLDFNHVLFNWDCF